MQGIHFAEVRARVTLAHEVDVLGFVSCDTSNAICVSSVDPSSMTITSYS